MTGITENLSHIRREIAAIAGRYDRPPKSVRLVAVSKTHAAAMIREAFAAGQRDFGESYAQEAVRKIDSLREPDIVWHFIGRIQSNKAKAIAQQFNWVHTIDRADLAERLARYRPHHGPVLQVCLQVNVTGDPARRGVSLADAAALAETVAGMPRLRLRGLMCLPPPETALARQRRHFRHAREALRALNDAGHALDTLSMGMSGDLEAAIAEGATMVRVGTAIFGPRQQGGAA